jgi:CheY-like chemotaxis protein
MTGDEPLYQPLASELTVSQTPAATLEIPRIDLRSKRILVAEDTPDTQELLSLYLRESGACVTVAANGSEAIEATRNAERAGAPFDIILMDMRMPGLDGYAATAVLRREGVDCPIIALTAYAMKGDEQSCRAAGCDAYVTKPINMRDLFVTMDGLLPRENTPVPESSEMLTMALVSQKITEVPFLPLLEKYLNRLPEMLEEVQQARREGEHDRLCSIVHRLRGTATNYGFPQITAVADRCETALRAHSEPAADLDRSLDELIKLVDMAIETWRKETSEC